MSEERENLTWENYGTAARDLAKIVAMMIINLILF